MDDDIVQVGHCKFLVRVQHEVLECCWCPMEAERRTQYCQWPDKVVKAVFSQAWDIRATCQYPLVRSRMETKQALPS